MTQEVFYKMIINKTKVDAPKKWLYTIAKNVLIDYYRKKKIITEEMEPSFVEYVTEEKNLLLTEEQQKRLKTYLQSIITELPEVDQKLITMHEIEGFSQKEIADQLDMNPATVRSKIQRTRTKLKKKITDCCQVIQGGRGSLIDYKRKFQSDCPCQLDCK